MTGEVSRYNGARLSGSTHTNTHINKEGVIFLLFRAFALVPDHVPDTSRKTDNYRIGFSLQNSNLYRSFYFFSSKLYIITHKQAAFFAAVVHPKTRLIFL